MPNILIKLGFTKEKAEFIASKIAVEAARGSGHAWGAEMKSDKSLLRARIPKDGFNYKGYNIAIHEFGHNVEQTLTLQDVDYYMLKGVPNTAFTEAMAFLFQKRDLDLLGMKDNDPNKLYLMALDNFWSSYEIMGVAMVDMNVWRWLYANPNASAVQLKEAVISIAKEIWNKYYADVFGIKDQPILAIYSHMIDNPLYLSNYPIGHLIDLQIDKYVEGKKFGEEIQKMLVMGSVIPQEWMIKAVGAKISIEPTLQAASEALKYIK
jgi:oligoendopeptidase F